VTKVVINRRYGGFGLSVEAVEWLREHNYAFGDECLLAGEKYGGGCGTVPEFVAPTVPHQIDRLRASEGLIAVVETLGSDASGDHADLTIVEVPDNVEWTIEEHDGYEHIAEGHQTWP